MSEMIEEPISEELPVAKALPVEVVAELEKVGIAAVCTRGWDGDVLSFAFGVLSFRLCSLW